MQLADYLRILRRRGLLVVVAALLGVAGAYGATTQQHKVYRTFTQLVVSVTQTGLGGETSRRPLAIDEAVALAQLAHGPTAVSAAVAEAGVGGVSSVVATADGNSPFIYLTVSGSDPVAIAKIANAYKNVLPEVQQRLQQGDPGTTVTLIADQPATVNTIPVSPRPKQNLAIGLALGLALGLAAALAREALDRRVRDSADLERTSGLPLLGSIPKELDDELVPAWSHSTSLRAEAYRLVRANLQFTDLPDVTPSLLVTSSNPGDGKTSLATNLAVSFALAGERVIIVDCDLRRPRVGPHFGLAPATGLSQVLAGLQPLDLKVTVMQGLDVLPSGPQPPNPSELLGSTRMLELLAHLTRSYDRVILDGPPILAVADAVKLAGRVTGVLLVLRIGATTTDDITRAKQSLDLAGARVLGLVANQVRPGQDGAYGYGTSAGYGYAPKPSKRRRKRASSPAHLAPEPLAWPPFGTEPEPAPPREPIPAPHREPTPAPDSGLTPPPAPSGPVSAHEPVRPQVGWPHGPSTEVAPTSLGFPQSHPFPIWPTPPAYGD